MNRKVLFTTLIGLVMLTLVLSAFVPSGAWSAVELLGKPTNRISGEWHGTMSFTDNPNRKENIVVGILKGCKPGNVCGQLENTTVSCTWELTYQGFERGRYVFTHSRTLSGPCPNPGVGYYRLQKDGTLYREHVTQLFTAYGALTR